MATRHTDRSVSRRTALAGLGAGGLGLALAATARHAAAQDAAAEMANHPLVGTWLAGTGPTDLAVVHLDADGAMTYSAFSVATGPDHRMIHSTPFARVWEPDGARGIHVTFTAMTYDVANEDGESFWDDGTRAVATVRDATGAVSQEITTVPAVAGVRMAPGKPGYDEVLALLAAGPAATPTA